MKKIYFLLMIFTSFTYAQAPFIFTWNVDNTVMPMNSPVTGTNYRYTIDFGDGTILTNRSRPVSHRYSREGIYTVKISGNFHQVEFATTSSNLLSVEQWGDIQWTSMENAFRGAYYTVFNATDIPDFSHVTNMREMFRSCSLFNLPVNSWDVSNVTDMSMMFYSASSFNQPLDNWDVSNVTNMLEMFAGASVFNQPLNNWDVSNVTNMRGMFDGAHNFNQPLNDWDVSNVENMISTFEHAEHFNQSLSSWDVSNVKDMSSMFASAASFNQPINNWDVANVTDMNFMFFFSTSFNQPLDDWDVSNVTDMSGVFNYARAFNQPLDDWDVSNVTKMFKMFDNANMFNQPLDHWDVSNVVNMLSIFSNAVAFNQDLFSWNFNNGIHAISYDYSGLNTDNYDRILLRFAQLGLQNVFLYADDLKYCDYGVHQYLVDQLGWTITDIEGESCRGNIISGNIRYDENGNGCETSDLAINNFIINTNNGLANYSTSANNGSYILNVLEDTYDVEVLNIPHYYTVFPLTPRINFSGFNNTQELDFCLASTQTVNDLNITILPLTDARPGFDSMYKIVINNIGTENVNQAVINLVFDNRMQEFVTANPAATSSTSNQLNFRISDLQPFETEIITFTMNTFAPPVLVGGEIINFTATINPNIDDYTPVDNFFNLAQIVVNSFDPNDKRVLQGNEIFIEQADEYLTYIIRFQNTGSASASTVKVVDQLDENLDWSTLMPLTSSHNYSMSLTDRSQLQFTFSDIGLPNEAANEENSHGFVAYKIKPIAGLEVGDIITGSSSIYFDYNLPVITNTVRTEIVSSLRTDTVGKTNNTIIFPNPVDNLLNIQVTEGIDIETIQIFNLQGRELITYNHNINMIDVQSLSSGIYLIIINTNRGENKYRLIKK